MLIAAFDPGGTTGYCLIHFGQEKPFKIMKSGTITFGDWGAFELLAEILQGYDCKTVVYETWRLFPGSAVHKINSDFPEIRVIGALEYLAYIHKWTLYGQAPSIKTAFPDNELQVHLGEHIKGYVIHTRDAMRHALYCYYSRFA